MSRSFLRRRERTAPDGLKRMVYEGGGGATRKEERCEERSLATSQPAPVPGELWGRQAPARLTEAAARPLSPQSKTRDSEPLRVSPPVRSTALSMFVPLSAARPCFWWVSQALLRYMCACRCN